MPASRNQVAAGGAFLVGVTLHRVADAATAAQKRLRDKDLQQARTALLQAQHEWDPAAVAAPAGAGPPGDEPRPGHHRPPPRRPGPAGAPLTIR